LTLGPDDNLHVEGFALNVFAKADKQDHAGRADMYHTHPKILILLHSAYYYIFSIVLLIHISAYFCRNTAKTFYAASIFFEILNQFGELQPEVCLLCYCLVPSSTFLCELVCHFRPTFFTLKSVIYLYVSMVYYDRLSRSRNMPSGKLLK
jgi:hypothetical protein